MQSTDIPVKFPIPFANGADTAHVRQVPTPSQIPTTAGAASLTDGFPPLTSTPIASGGVPPDIRDMNGVLRQATAWDRWQAAGGAVPYDASFQSSISGYPLGAVVTSATMAGVSYLSTVEANTTNPDTGGAGWVRLCSPVLLSPVVLSGSGNYTVPAGVTRLFVRRWGGGGGGGGAAVNTTGTGGGSGAYAEDVMPVTPGQVIAYAVGAGGGGGTPSVTGGTGGATTFGALTAVASGLGGYSSTTGGGAGGALPAAVGFGMAGGGGQGGFAPVANIGGQGGSAPMGGQGGGIASGSPGNPGSGVGAGGGGAGSTSTVANNGAAGQPGAIVIGF